MKLCPKCNTQLEDSAAFCPNCGTQFIPNATVTQQPYVPVDSSDHTAEFDAAAHQLFSEDRKKGDVKYFEFADKGVAIYVFEEFGKASWNVAVEGDMKNEDYEKLCKELEEKYPVTVNAKAIAKIS